MSDDERKSTSGSAENLFLRRWGIFQLLYRLQGLSLRLSRPCSDGLSLSGHHPLGTSTPQRRTSKCISTATRAPRITVARCGCLGEKRGKKPGESIFSPLTGIADAEHGEPLCCMGQIFHSKPQFCSCAIAAVEVSHCGIDVPACRVHEIDNVPDLIHPIEDGAVSLAKWSVQARRETWNVLAEPEA